MEGGARTEGGGGRGWWREGESGINDAQAVDPISAFAGQPMEADLGRETASGRVDLLLLSKHESTSRSTRRVIVFVEWEEKWQQLQI